MKKFLFTIAALALGLQMNAQTISFGPLNDEGYIEVPQGGQATVAVQYTKDSKTIVKGYKFTLTFTDGTWIGFQVSGTYKIKLNNICVYPI